MLLFFFFFQAEDGIRDKLVTGVQTCALPIYGHVAGAWFSSEDYHGLGKFRCDGVYLRSDFKPKQGTWKPGLAMSVKEGEGGQVQVKVRATADNPKDNRDRKVDILFEVMNGEKVIASASDS